MFLITYFAGLSKSESGLPIRDFGALALFFILPLISAILLPYYKIKVSKLSHVSTSFFLISNAIYFIVMPIIIYTLSVMIVGVFN